MAAGNAVLNIKILTDATQAQKGLDATASKAGRMGSGIRKAAAPAALALAGIGAAAFAAGQAAADDAQSQAILANALKKNTGASDAAVAATEAHLAAMSAATGVADDELRPAMGNLVRATGDTAKAQSLLASSMDVAAATGTDLETVSKAMAKASQGNTGALRKLVPGLDAATLASGDMTAIQADLASQVGGASAAAADTAAGKMDKMKNSMSEAQESIGTALLPVMSTLADKLAAVAKWIGENSTLVGVIVGVIAAFAAVIVVLNVAMTIYSTVTAVAAVAEGALLLPILLVIAAIIALIVVVVLIVKHWDTIKRVALQVWAAIKTATAAVVDWIKGKWAALVMAMKIAILLFKMKVAQIWAGIKSAVGAAMDWVRAKWKSVTDALKTAVTAVKDFFVTRFTNLKNNIGRIADGVKRVWDNVFAALKRAVDNISGLIQKPFDAVKGAIDSVIGAIRSLIDWFGRIHVPKISLPHIPGFNSTTTVAAPVGAAAARGLAAPTASPRRSTAGGLTIVIQGAIDPESTARQVRRLLASHDRRMGLTGAGLRTGLV